MDTPAQTLDDFITTSQAAKLLGVTRQRVGVLISTGRLPGSRQVGPVWLIPRAAISGFRRGIEPAAAAARAKKAWISRRKNARKRRKSSAGNDLKNLDKSA